MREFVIGNYSHRKRAKNGRAPADRRRQSTSGPERVDDVQHVVPRTLGVSAALSWRLLVIVAALYVIGTVVAYPAASWSRSPSPCRWPLCRRDQLLAVLNANRASIASGALTTAATVGGRC